MFATPHREQLWGSSVYQRPALLRSFSSTRTHRLSPNGAHYILVSIRCTTRLRVGCTPSALSALDGLRFTSHVVLPELHVPHISAIDDQTVF